MEFSEYRRYDAIGLAELVQTKQVTSEELLDIAIARAAEVNPKINALHTPLHDYSRQQAKKTDTKKCFAGVPFLLKDLQHALKGFPLASGSAACSDYVPSQNSSIVDRYLGSGLLPFSKTTTPEFGLLGITEAKAYGATRNPWDLERTPGGSSGGSAAAVAAGIVPMASANDGGGSIRIPASHCGLFGLKPTRARVPVGPNYSEVWMGASADHVLTRSVRDSALMLDVLQGMDIGAPFEIKLPSCTYSEILKQEPSKLKVAFSTESPIGTDVDQSCIDAVMHTVKKLEDLGHYVEEAKPHYNGLELAHDYLMLYFATVASTVRGIREELGYKGVAKLELLTRTLATLGETISAGEFYKSKQNWNTYGRCMGQFHQMYDLYLTPSVAMPALKIGEKEPNPMELLFLSFTNKLGLGKLLLKSGLVEKIAKDNLGPNPFSQLANLTGQPAMSVPLHWTKEKLPIGVQFIAPVGEEGLLLQLAAQLEQAHPWFNNIAEIEPA